MKAFKEHKGISGIYCIKNKANGKVYIGKSICIYRRIQDHIRNLNKKSKDENIHLINSWHFHGSKSFEYFVVEILELNEDLISERETYWQEYYNCHNSEFGFNLRKDTKTKMICSEETKKRLSIANYKKFEKFPELKKTIGEMSSKFWKENVEIKENMADLVSKIRTKYEIVKLDYDMNILQVWETQRKLKKENPELYLPAILQVCNGNKNSYLNHIWRYRKIDTKEIIYQKHPKERKLESKIKQSFTGPILMKDSKNGNIIKEYLSLTIACEDNNLKYGIEYQRLNKNKFKNQKIKRHFYFEYKNK